MFHRRQTLSARLFVVGGILVMLMGIGGSWGVAFGQSGGTPPPQQTSPDVLSGGAEGEPAGAAVQPAARPAVVAGESGVAPLDAAAGESEAVLSESEAVLPVAGGDSAYRAYWSIIAIGMLLILIGGALSLQIGRARKN